MAVYQGDARPNTFDGTTANDTIFGREANDTLSGGGGNDLIYGGMGNDLVSVGAAGGTSYRSIVYGSEGADTVTSFGGVNTIIGGTGIGSIDPNDGADFIDAQNDGPGDLILGNGGDDTILGSTMAGGGFGQNPSGLTQIFGGMGDDQITYNQSGSSAAPAVLVGNEGNDVIFTFSAATVYGGQGDDQIGSTRSGDRVIFGGEGADAIANAYVDNQTIFGGTGVSSIDSTSVDGADAISIGYARNLSVFSNYGDDAIAVGFAENAQVFGGQGDDAISIAFSSNDLLLGNEGSDAIAAFIAGSNTIYGGSGDDAINLLTDNADLSVDLIYGGEGNDTIVVSGSASSSIFGGTDSIGTDDGINFIDLSGVRSQAISAPMLRERVYGGAGIDAVSVGSALDAVTITGAGGTNQYAFTANSMSGASTGGAGSGLDQITDFVSGTDKFYLTTAAGAADVTVNSVFGAGASVSQSDLTTAANQALGFASVVGANAATFNYQGSNYVVVDADGSNSFSSGGDFLINIAGTTSLTKNDFV